MFNTTLTKEYQAIAAAFDFDAAMIQRLVMNGVHASLLPAAEKQHMVENFTAQFNNLLAAK